jgi:hypothetical protein
LPRLEHLEDRFAPAVTDLTTQASFATIQAAVNAANPGDTVLADAGTYAEQVTINKSIILEGAQHGVDAQDGRPGAMESIVDGGGFSPFLVTASNVTIDGFTVQGANNNNNAFPNLYGIDLNQGTFGANILNNIIQNNTIGIALANNSATTPAIIQHNLIQNNNQAGPSSGHGIYTDQFVGGGTVSDVLIDSNTFSGNDPTGTSGAAAIGFSSTDATMPATNITISNNDFNTNGRAVYAFSLTNSSITGNTLRNAGWAASADIRLFEGVNGLTISGNLMENGAGRAVRISNVGTGLPNATNVTLSENSISGYTGPADTVNVDPAGYTGTLNASGNWWGTAIGANPSDSTAPTAIDKIVSGSVHIGSFLDSGTNAATGTGFTAAATTEMWVPNTGATSGLTHVAGVIQDGINTAVPGMTVRVAADTYAENDIVNKSVTLIGANNTNPVPGRSGPETVVEPGLTSSFDTSSIFTVEANDVTIEGFTIRGSITSPSLGQSAGFTLTSGVTVYAAAGISNSSNVNTGGSSPSTTNISGLTVQNNIIQDFTQVGVYGDTSDGTVSTGNIIADNVITDIPNNSEGGYYGEGVIIYDNFYANVTGNQITKVRTGIQTGNNYLSAGSFVPSISNNTVSAYVKGIYYNLQYESASSFTIADNTITQADGSVSPAYNVGLLIQSIQSSVQSNITGNDVSGFLYGVEFAGNNTTNTVTVNGGQLNDNTYGVWATNNDYFYAANYNTTAALDGVTITNSKNAGVWVDSTSPNSSNVFNTTNTVSLAISGGTAVTGGAVGLQVSGGLAAITGNTLNDTSFSGQSVNYITLDHGALAGPTTLDATGVTFDGHTGATATLAQNFAIEDKITDYLDDGTLGYVQLNAGQVYVAHSSEAASPGAVQRGVNVALAGDVVNLQAGTYVANGNFTVSGSAVGAAGQEVAGLNINKPLTLLGPNPTFDPNSSLAPANDQAIIVPGASDPNPYDPNAVIVMLISSSNVTVQGITVDGINTTLTHYSDPGTVSGHTGYVTAYGSTAPIDAAEDIASYADVSNVTLQNNLIQNAGYIAVDFVNGTDYSGAATTGSLITRNLIQNTSDAYFYGDGVNLYDNFYADVTHNVIQDVRTGVQLGNYSQANPNADPAQFANVANNTVSADRIGLWYNLFYQSSSPFTFVNNTISALPLAANSRWDGVLISSVQDSSSGMFQGNTIDGTKADPSKSSEGYDVWNTPTTGQLLISGGSVTGVDYGVWVNTYEGGGGAAANTQVTVNDLDITASQIGVYVEASSQNTTGATATATIDSTTFTTAGSGVGVMVSGATASAAVANSSITGNATGIDVEGASSLTARNNFITGNTGPALLVGGTGTPSVTIQDNDLSNNGATVVQNNNSSITVDAAEDYWGSANLTPAAVAGLVSGQVNFEPILTTGDADSLTPGFQPDTTKLAVDISSGTTNPTPGSPYRLNLAPSNSTANNATITQWVINWGDGTPNTTVSSPTIPASVTHLYAKDGNYTITATATDELGNPANSNSLSVSVGALSSSQSDLTPPTATEGKAFGPVTVFRFTDSDPNGTVSDYVATVQTGDATLTSTANPSDVTIVADTVNGGFDVQLSYTYVEELHNATFSVSVTDGSASTSQSTSILSVADAALTTNSFSPPVATEGASFSGTVLNFSDANANATAADYTAVVTLGDGNTVTLTSTASANGQIVAHGDGTFDVNLTYTYAEELSGQTFSVVVTDHNSQANGNTNSFSVADADLTAGTLTPPSGAVEGTQTNSAVLFHFTDANPNATVADYKATVTWGDGTVEDSVNHPTAVQVVANPKGGFDVVGSHAYTSAATGMIFKVQVQDQGGASTSASAPVSVSGDVVINGTAGDDSLVLTRNGSEGTVTYVLNNGTPVTLTDIHSFTFNGLGGNDTMTVKLSGGVPLVPGNVHFDGGPGINSLVIDAAGTPAQGVLHTQPGMLDADGQAVSYANVASVNLNNTTAVNAIPGPNTADRATAFSGLTANERFVQALYLDNLGRAGSKAELDIWLPVLGASGQQAVAGDILGSFEARDHLVKSWYQAYLGRAANGTEELGWVGLLGAGQSEEQVLSHILGSPEFYNRAQALVSGGTADQRYVQALYQVLLERSAAETEVAGWGNYMSHAGQPAVALAFLGSPEFRTHQFEGYYNALLHRPDDPAGLNNWVMSSFDMHTARTWIEGSSEFFSNG